MRLALLAVMLVAPLAGAADSCVLTACVATENVQHGDGSCDEGAFYHERHEARVEGEAAEERADARVFSDCSRFEGEEGLSAYRELAVIVGAGPAEIVIVWWQDHDRGFEECHMSVTSPVARSADCVAPPPMLPTLP